MIPSTVTDFLTDFFAGIFRKSHPANNRNALAPDEQRFLKIVEPLGLDWVTPCSAYMDKYGKVDNGNATISAHLPPSTVFSASPLRFEIISNLQSCDLPPGYLRAKFDAHNDTRRNFEQLENEMAEKLGKGVRADVANCLIRRWIFGIFKVELMAWPFDMQADWMKEQSKNDPSKFNEATVTISSFLTNIYPRRNLEWIMQALSNAGIQSGGSVQKFELIETTIPSIYIARN